MSAFILNEYHLSVLGRAASVAHTYNSSDILTEYNTTLAAIYAQTLYAENVRSVQYRYSTDKEEYPEEIVFDRRALQGTLDPVQVIKAAHCYTYQACETDDYKQSAAAKLIDNILDVCTRALPGYESAQWVIDPPPAITAGAIKE
jgi:hypothetical protein